VYFCEDPRKIVSFYLLNLFFSSAHFEIDGSVRLACRVTLNVHLGKALNIFASAVAQMIFVKHRQKVRGDDVHLQFGKPHAKARMPADTPANEAVWHFFILCTFGQVSGRIPLLWVGIDSGIVVHIAEMICLVRRNRQSTNRPI
jgi:hypothetical protein